MAAAASLPGGWVTGSAPPGPIAGARGPGSAGPDGAGPGWGSVDYEDVMAVADDVGLATELHPERLVRTLRLLIVLLDVEAQTADVSGPLCVFEYASI